MSDTNKRNSVGSESRRGYLRYVGAAGAIGLAGCSGDGGDGGDTGGDGGDTGGDGGDTGGDGGSTDPAPAVEEFVIGSNHPLSGSLAFTGESMTRAMELAAQQRNEAGGIEALDGAEVRIERGDNEARQELAGQVSEQLMDDGADVVTGCFNSDATLSATAATEREGVPFVITVAASDRILKGRDMNYTYRLQPTTFHYARDWARFYPELVRGEGHTLDTYAHYYIDNAYGSEIFEYIRDDFGPQNDLELVESTAVTLDQSDANAQVTRIREADPDGVVLTGYQQDALMFFNALADLEWRPTWLSASASVALVSADQIEQIGEPAEGIMDANYALNPNNDLTDSFKSEYSDFADRSPTPEAGLAWSTCQVIFDAAERAGSTDPDALNDAIAATDMGPEETPIALDGVAFQDNGENEHALAALNQVRDGEINVVYPEEFAAMDPLIEPGQT